MVYELTCTNGTTTAEIHRSSLRMLMPTNGSVSVSTLSKLSSHIMPDVAHEMFTIVNKQTAGARSSFKYFNSLPNSAISYVKKNNS